MIKLILQSLSHSSPQKDVEMSEAGDMEALTEVGGKEGAQGKYQENRSLCVPGLWSQTRASDVKTYGKERPGTKKGHGFSIKNPVFPNKPKLKK